MTERLHKIFLVTFLLISLILVIQLKPPIRNYIPVLFGIVGFGFYGFLSWKTYLNVSFKVIEEHNKELKENGINYYHNRFTKSLDFLDFVKKKNILKKLSPEIEKQVSLFSAFYKLTLITILSFALLGIVTVLLTW